MSLQQPFVWTIVTWHCRYVPSLVAAEKLRVGGWWDETLRPLRKLEAAPRLQAVACESRNSPP